MSFYARALDNWRSLVSATEPREGVMKFLAAFFGVQLLYDFLDLLLGATASNYWLVPDAGLMGSFKTLQLGLVLSEAWIVFSALSLRNAGKPGRFLSPVLFVNFGLRAFEAGYFFGLNDFYFFALVSLIVAHGTLGAPLDRSRRWPRVVLRYQTAWIYCATGILKLNTHWLSGEHLWVRQNYLLKVLGWPYPSWLHGWIGSLSWNQALAAGGAAGELGLAVALLLGAPRSFCLVLAILMHGFAALALNVWFFGVAMVVLVHFVSERRNPAEISTPV